MEAIVLVGGFLFLGAFGFWLMDKLDRFLDSGGFSPYWDEADSRRALAREREASTPHDGASSPAQSQAGENKTAPRR